MTNYADLLQKRQFGRTFAVSCRFADIMILHTDKNLLPFCRFAVFTAILQNSLPHVADLPQKRKFCRTFKLSCPLGDIMSHYTHKILLPICCFAVVTAIQKNILPHFVDMKNGNSAEPLPFLADLLKS